MNKMIEFFNWITHEPKDFRLDARFFAQTGILISALWVLILVMFSI